jgi:hypothetical protein
VALPAFDLVFLSGADGAGHDLKNVGWSAAVAVLESSGHTKDKFSAKFAGCLCGNRCDQSAIDEAARSNIDRFEQTWESAAGADRVLQIAVGENDRLTTIKVGGNDCERDAQIFEILRVENAVDQVTQAMVAGESEARNAPAADVAELKGAASGDDARQRSTAGIGCTENAANTCACDARNRDSVLLEHLKNAEVREAACKASAERDADTCPTGQGRWNVRSGLKVACHERIMASVRERRDSSGVLP